MRKFVTFLIITAIFASLAVSGVVKIVNKAEEIKTRIERQSEQRTKKFLDILENSVPVKSQ
jgi:hypothetical protein